MGTIRKVMNSGDYKNETNRLDAGVWNDEKYCNYIFLIEDITMKEKNSISEKLHQHYL